MRKVGPGGYATKIRCVTYVTRSVYLYSSYIKTKGRFLEKRRIYNDDKLCYDYYTNGKRENVQRNRNVTKQNSFAAREAVL